MEVSYVYRVLDVTKVIDGDTVDLLVDLGFRVCVNQRFRLLGVNTPEIYRPVSEQEKLAGLKCKTYLEECLLVHRSTLVVKSYKTDVYGRYLGEIFYKDEVSGQFVSVNSLMVEFVNKLSASETT